MASAPLDQEEQLKPLYPAVNIYSNPHGYRLQEIAIIRTSFETEINNRLHFYKRYKRASIILSWIRFFLTSASLLLGAASIGSLSNVIASELAIIFESVSLALGVFGIIVSVIEDTLFKKIRKHDEIHTLAASKLSTIADYLSKALEDGSISEEEFKLILNEHGKFIDLKQAVKQASWHQADAEEMKRQFAIKSKVHI